MPGGRARTRRCTASPQVAGPSALAKGVRDAIYEVLAVSAAFAVNVTQPSQSAVAPNPESREHRPCRARLGPLASRALQADAMEVNMRCSMTVVLLIAAMGMTGCGDAPEAPESEDVTPASGSATDETPPPETADTPKAMGEVVATLYVDTMKSVTEAVEGRPEAAEVRPELERIKAEAVERLVELGRKREALDDADKAVFDRQVRGAMRGVQGEVFQAFSEAHKHYMEADRELGDLLASFNVITQYAAFELLKKQEPEEYERLGLGE